MVCYTVLQPSWLILSVYWLFMYNVELIKNNRLKLLVIMGVGYWGKKKPHTYGNWQLESVTNWKCKPYKVREKEGNCEETSDKCVHLSLSRIVIYSHLIMSFSFPIRTAAKYIQRTFPIWKSTMNVVMIYWIQDMKPPVWKICRE